jgi:hypothetical protein
LIILPVGRFVIFVIFLQASQAAAGKKNKARVFSMDSILKEWNLEYFNPAGYSLAADNLCGYFDFASNSFAPGNVVNIV